MISSAEDAYKIIARVLNEKAQPGWSKLKIDCPILNKNCGGITTFRFNGDEKTSIAIGRAIFEIQEACLFVRADFMEKTGQRIWGLAFTLYPDGKFNMDFDYVKPEGYEETDKTIDVSLTDFAEKVNNENLQN